MPFKVQDKSKEKTVENINKNEDKTVKLEKEELISDENQSENNKNIES